MPDVKGEFLCQTNDVKLYQMAIFVNGSPKDLTNGRVAKDVPAGKKYSVTVTAHGTAGSKFTVKIIGAHEVGKKDDGEGVKQDCTVDNLGNFAGSFWVEV